MTINLTNRLNPKTPVYKMMKMMDMVYHLKRIDGATSISLGISWPLRNRRLGAYANAGLSRHTSVKGVKVASLHK